MKKVLALVLAVVLCMGLGVVAFADYGADTNGTSKIEIIAVMNDAIKADDLKASFDWEDGKEYFKSVEIEDLDQDAGAKAVYTVTLGTALTAGGEFTIEGETYAFAAGVTDVKDQMAAWKTASASNVDWDVTGDGTGGVLTFTGKTKGAKAAPVVSDNLTVAKVTDGKPEVAAKSVKVTVKFKDYYGVDDIDIDFDLSLKKGSTKKSFSVNGDTAATTYNVSTTFGWAQANATGDDDDASVIIDFDNGDVIFEDDDVTFVTFEFANVDALSVAGKMSKQDAVNVGLDTAVTDEIKALMKKNENVDFDVLNFVGKPEFDFTQEVTYYIDDEDVTYYVYEIKDGKAVKVNAKLNDDKDALVWKTRVLGCYVVTDAVLEAAAADPDKDGETGEKDNPETGASDFVGVAIALGAVSLVAAGAVALKK